MSKYQCILNNPLLVTVNKQVLIRVKWLLTNIPVMDIFNQYILISANTLKLSELNIT